MNYLAHLLLSNYNEDILIGNFITDFITKPQEKDFDDKIQVGIKLHRMIDEFTDDHKIVKEGLSRLRKHQGKYAPVVLDICYDHLLARNWNNYSDVHIDLFATHTYKQLESHYDILPKKLMKSLPAMIKGNWLMSYEHRSGLEYTFERLTKRVKFENSLPNAVEDFYKDYAFYEAGFLKFFPELQEMSRVFCELNV